MEPPKQLIDLQGLFSNIISLAIGAAAVVCFFLFIIGGFQYLTASGNEQAAAGARKTLTFAILGVVLIVLSFLALRLISAFTGVDVTHFSVTQ